MVGLALQCINDVTDSMDLSVLRFIFLSLRIAAWNVGSERLFRWFGFAIEVKKS